MHPLSQKVKRNIEPHQSLLKGATAIIGVSGGPDSTALTCILGDLQYEFGLHLRIAHYNHHLHRGANADQKCVEDLAKHLNLPLSVGHWKNPGSLKKGSLEDAARNRRMQFFKRIAQKNKARTVILAHTQNDLSETVLMRILRGTGLQGLQSILPVRKIQDIILFRPLLNVKKKEILAFLEDKKIPYRIDPTNTQTKFFRNKVRLELLPLLAKEYNPNITHILTNLANNVVTDYAYLEEQTNKLFSRHTKYSKNRQSLHIDKKALTRQHPSLQRMLIRRGIEHVQGNLKRLTLTHLHEIEDLLANRPNASIVHLPKNITIQKTPKYLTLTKN